MRPILTGLVCFVSLLSAIPAQAGWRDWVYPNRCWQKIKNCCSSSKQKVTNYCDQKVEKAKADQRKQWGIHLPADFDPGKPLVLCIHGLNSNNGVFNDITRLMRERGWQVGVFGYPADAPIAGDIELLEKELAAFHEKYPQTRLSIIGHSMGSIVARGYIEGERYVHPVQRFIAIAPPNHGSSWAGQRWILELRENFAQWRYNEDYSPIWAFTDGRGEAGDDLRPGSAFLKQLNARPRRAGVKYTTIAGDQHIIARWSAQVVACTDDSLPKKHWWGIRHTSSGLHKAEHKLREQHGRSDGVVELASTRLEGVEDVVVVHADHNALAMSIGNRPPAAWETIAQRLGEVR